MIKKKKYEELSALLIFYSYPSRFFMADLKKTIKKTIWETLRTMICTKMSNPAHQLLSQFLVNWGTFSRRVSPCCSLRLSKIRIWTNQKIENLQQNLALE